MKRTWGIIACILLIVGCHTSKRPVLYSLEKHEDVDLNALKNKHPFQESVYLSYKRDISHDLKPDVTNNSPRWYFFESYHWKEVVLSDERAENTPEVTFTVGRSEKIRNFQARITSPGQKGILYKRKDLDRKRLSSDSSKYTLAVGSLPAGTSIEVTYEIERKKLLKQPPLSHDVPLQLDRPVEHLEFSYTYPWHWEVQMKQVAPSKYVHVKETEDKKAETQTYTYTSTNVPAFVNEFYGPHFKQVSPYFHVKVNHIEVGNELEWSARGTWERVAEKFLYVSKTSRRTKKLAQKRLQGLGIDVATPELERIALIQGHVESDIKVVSNSGKRSIWKSGKGDALDAAVYMSVLLEEAGIQNDFLLAHTAEEGFFDETFISEDQFYAPVLRAGIDGNDFYLFPDKEGIPLGYIPVEYSSQVAFLYTDKTYQGIVTVPGTPEFAYRDDGYYKLLVNRDGSVKAEVNIDLSLHTSFRLNQAQLNGSQNEHQLIQELLAHDAKHIEGLSYMVFSSEGGTGERLKASYELVECFNTSNERVVIQSCGLFEPMNTAWYPFQESRVTTPMLPADIRVTNHVQIVYPEDWTLSSTLDNVAEKGKQVIFERTYASREGQLDINQHLILQRQPIRSVINPLLAQAYQLPLGTTLSSIKLSTSPQFAITELPTLPGGPWTVIVETYDSYEAAVDKALELESSSSIEAMPVRILSEGPVDDKYHVLLGNFDSRRDVENARIVLSKELPFNAWIALVNPQMTAVLNSSEPITY